MQEVFDSNRDFSSIFNSSSHISITSLPCEGSFSEYDEAYRDNLSDESIASSMVVSDCFVWNHQIKSAVGDCLHQLGVLGKVDFRALGFHINVHGARVPPAISVLLDLIPERVKKLGLSDLSLWQESAKAVARDCSRASRILQLPSPESASQPVAASASSAAEAADDDESLIIPLPQNHDVLMGVMLETMNNSRREIRDMDGHLIDRRESSASNRKRSASSSATGRKPRSQKVPKTFSTSSPKLRTWKQDYPSFVSQSVKRLPAQFSETQQLALDTDHLARELAQHPHKAHTAPFIKSFLEARSGCCFSSLNSTQLNQFLKLVVLSAQSASSSSTSSSVTESSMSAVQTSESTSSLSESDLMELQSDEEEEEDGQVGDDDDDCDDGQDADEDEIDEDAAIAHILSKNVCRDDFYFY